MISADHPRFSCTSDMSLTIYGKIFSGPLVHTNDPSGTGVSVPVFDANTHSLMTGVVCTFTKHICEMRRLTSRMNVYKCESGTYKSRSY